MIKAVRVSALFLVLVFILLPFSAQARKNVDYWYIKDFQSEIVVNKDSSLDITEKITADCGLCQGKHGIFRILPTRVKTDEGKIIKSPVKLISITDFNDAPLKYQENKNLTQHTITWKIGDANVMVQGVNYYKIAYHIENAIRFNNSNLDEFYWNLLGNFWELEIDSFTAKIIFPQEINKNNSAIDYYSGSLGSKSKAPVGYQWLNDNTLQFSSSGTLAAYQGITASVAVPKGIFTPYQPGFLERFGDYFYFLIPLAVLILCYLLWARFGRDPKINPTIVPEFAVPNGLNPMEMGAVITDGVLANTHISAAIVALAVKGAVRVIKVQAKSIFGREDYQLALVRPDLSDLVDSEKLLLNKLFTDEKEILLSSLRNKFYQEVGEISQMVNQKLAAEKLLVSRSRKLWGLFLIFAGWCVLLGIWGSKFNSYLGISVYLSAAIWFIFAFLIKVRTKEGAILLRKIKGFELYMKTAERYRQQFHEKEGTRLPARQVFEKYLPYAMLFGLTRLWIKKMKIIYGEDYFAGYHPVWFIGISADGFDVRGFDSAVNSLSSAMNSALSSPSGAGGAGGAGGGGGGGGGGGW